MQKKLAIVISSAVSLGSYEAGVVFEILAALESHNNAHPGSEILIDVITGASAGGMNAVILAQKLLFQPSRLRDVFDNDLYLPWVKDVDLTGLLNTRTDESPVLSALSSDLVESIADKYIVSPFSNGVNLQPEPRHPAVAEQLQLGLAMSNLNGIDYGLELLSGGAMPYTRFQDQVIITVDSTDPTNNTADFWQPLRNAAIACGAFPFAFRVKDVLRHASDYADPKPLLFPATGMHFAYTDGGVFQNEPVSLAKRLVDAIDDHQGDQRYYLFVAPDMRQSACNDFSAAPPSTYFNYWNTGKALINGIFNQARYRDLQNVEDINDRILAFDDQAEGLKNLFAGGVVSAATLGPATLPLLQQLFPGAAAPNTLGQKGMAARARLQQQFTAEYTGLTDAVGAANADSWIDSVLLLETAAMLGPHDLMRVYSITADADKLAGDDFYAFGGFFDIAYRQHDYDRGRDSARRFIDWLNRTTPGLPPGTPSLGPIDYATDGLPPIEINSALDGIKVASMDHGKRQALYDRLHDRVNDLMVELGIDPIVREAIFLGYIDGALKKLLACDRKLLVNLTGSDQTSGVISAVCGFADQNTRQ